MTRLEKPLRGPMAAAAKRILAEFEEIRLGHRGEQGRRREVPLRDVLRQFLPPRLQLAGGQVVATTGEVSGQLDLIVYDGVHTPLLDKWDGSVSVPVEGVYGVIEVASHLSASKLEDEVKKIRRADAEGGLLLRASAGAKRTIEMWGQSFEHFPVLGFCFAYDSVELDTLIDAIQGIDDPSDLGSSVDMVCSLSKGCVTNGEPAPGGAGFGFKNPFPAPFPGSLRVGLEGTDAATSLMHFYLLAAASSPRRRLVPFGWLRTWTSKHGSARPGGNRPRTRSAALLEVSAELLGQSDDDALRAT